MHVCVYMCVCVYMRVCIPSCFSCVQLFVIPWAVACQVPLSMGFSKQEYWSGLPCPPPGNLLNPGIEPRSPAWQVGSLPLASPGKPRNKIILANKGTCLEA